MIRPSLPCGDLQGAWYTAAGTAVITEQQLLPQTLPQTFPQTLPQSLEELLEKIASSRCAARAVMDRGFLAYRAAELEEPNE